ncbi:MAG TPA: hypothetical protein VGG06_20225 [Thermoanaerobaculia bacterium]|jgi:hypothetical protein
MTTTIEPHRTERDAASIEQIADEHRALGESLARLEKTTDLHLLMPRLEKLRSQLEHHFAGEEASGGLRETVRAKTPFLLAALDRIFEEHRRFLGDLDELTEKTRACLAGPVAEILTSISALTRLLRDHEVREAELLSDVYYTDYGEGAD